MPVLHVNLEVLRTEYGTFHPYGPLRKRTVNPRRKQARSAVYAARIVVGLSVGDVPTYSMDHVIHIVEQNTPNDASFILQRGLFTSRKSGKRVREDSVQIVVFNDAGGSVEAFTDEMEDLARVICQTMGQEQVLLEIQRNGVQVDFARVEP